ncbi:dienelactone hydrolase family protein (plasmid) [Skermanella mucosa]|uniref:dienelactone hydrolase family protein n=1 Tax=Skermanella mucosa TaxID=1789672 RepID=UPI001E3A1790|nr:dienelactone hydrolase family protein [Skermanella mucosa]UEM24427.1 dienelactone hydrolase family protein [Skermanella mucosa]
MSLKAADGHRLGAYRARPASSLLGGLVVLQEIFGVNQHIREVCDGYAACGYDVIAPALFDRVQSGLEIDYGSRSIRTGRDLRAIIGWNAALLDVQAAIDAMDSSGPVAVIGYCWGGTLAFLAATRLRGLACAVGYYGGQTIPFAQETPRVPVLLHFGEHDPRISPEDRDTIARHNPEIEMRLYPADHGFNCNHRKEWHEPSARKALEITHAFLARHLHQPEALTA